MDGSSRARQPERVPARFYFGDICISNSPAASTIPDNVYFFKPMPQWCLNLDKAVFVLRIQIARAGNPQCLSQAASWSPRLVGFAPRLGEPEGRQASNDSPPGAGVPATHVHRWCPPSAGTLPVAGHLPAGSQGSLPLDEQLQVLPRVTVKPAPSPRRGPGFRHQHSRLLTRLRTALQGAASHLPSTGAIPFGTNLPHLLNQ